MFTRTTTAIVLCIAIITTIGCTGSVCYRCGPNCACKNCGTHGCKDCLRSPLSDGLYCVCRNCGTKWNRALGEELSVARCPNCPLEVCPQTAGWIIVIGSLQQAVRSNPDNAQYREELARYTTLLLDHCKTCESCRKQLGL